MMNALPVACIDPSEISNAVLFLASDEAKYITGATLTIDAGLTVK
jgi:NAD(P)-dependent dehydrogenase (short-subunit alcohol dehydrogenase family)